MVEQVTEPTITPESGITLGGIKVMLGIAAALVTFIGAASSYTLWISGKFSDIGYRLTSIEEKVGNIGHGHVEQARLELWIERARRAQSLSELPGF